MEDWSKKLARVCAGAVHETAPRIPALVDREVGRHPGSHALGVRRRCGRAACVARGGQAVAHAVARAAPSQARATGAATLLDEWRDWSRLFGPARDADVWQETLRHSTLRRDPGATAQGRLFLRAQLRQRKALQTSLCRRLRSARYARLLRRTETLMARDLPPCQGRTQAAQAPVACADGVGQGPRRGRAAGVSGASVRSLSAVCAAGSCAGGRMPCGNSANNGALCCDGCRFSLFAANRRMRYHTTTCQLARHMAQSALAIARVCSYQ